MSKMTTMELSAYAKAGAIAQEVLSSVRMVFAYNGADHEYHRYSFHILTMYNGWLYFRYTQHLTAARRNGIRKGIVFGIIMGFIRLVIFVIYAVGFIYGTRLIYEENSNIGDIFLVTDLFFPYLFKLKNVLSTRFSLLFLSQSFLLDRQQIRCGIKVVLYKNINRVFQTFFIDEAICAVDSIRTLLDIVSKTYIFYYIT